MTIINVFKPLTKDDIAEDLGVSVRTIENWVNDRTLPAPKRICNRVYWHPSIFYTWLELRLTADDAGGAPDLADKEPIGKLHKGNQLQAKPLATEVGKLRTRDQAKLDAMLSGPGM